jgi:AraC-like DNA-binding protein
MGGLRAKLCLTVKLMALGVAMPWSKVLSFTDPMTYQAAIRAADLEVFPTERGEFSAGLTQVTMNQVWMQRFHQSLPQVVTGSTDPTRRIVGFSTAEALPAVNYNGLRFQYGEIFVCASDEMHARTETGCQFGALSLTDEDRDAAYSAITGREFPKRPYSHIVRPSADAFDRLVGLHEIVGEIAQSTPQLLDLPEAVRALEQQLTYLLVRCLTDGAISATTVRGQRHDAIFARFEEYLEANPNKPLYLPEICAAVGAAERTLRVACEEHLAMGPIRYLSLRRMHLVHRELLRGNHSGTTVTRIATDHGFWELGRFATAYRTMFGETPSATLRRSPNDRPALLNRPTSLE